VRRRRAGFTGKRFSQPADQPKGKRADEQIGHLQQARRAMPTTTRVLHLITRLIVGGAQENTLDLAARLDPRRFQVEVLCGPQTGSEGSLIGEARAAGIPLAVLPELVREASPWRDLRAIAALARSVRAGGYDIVHTHSSKAGILGRIAARLAGTPVVVHTVHGWSFHPYMSPLARWVYILLERLAARFSDALVVVARGDIERGLQAGVGRAGQYHLIRSAIALEAFDPACVDRAAARAELGFPPEAVVIGNVGRFSAQKNPLDWVRAAGEIGRARPDCRFLLVGDGPLRASVEARLQAEGIANRTVLAGLRRDVPRLLGAMDIFLLTSLWEGLPRVIPQALAMQLPVVANQAGGAAEAVQEGKTGFLCAPGDPRQAAAHCLFLAAHPEARQRMGARGRAFALQEFDLKKMVAQVEALYERLLAVRR
jgi:glycosyltransferase involved in cell wall biosynthesis